MKTSIRILKGNQIMYNNTVEAVDAYFKKRVLLIDKHKDLLAVGKALSVAIRAKILALCSKDLPIKVVNDILQVSSPDLYYNLRYMLNVAPWMMQKLPTGDGLIYRPTRRYLLLDLGCAGDEKIE